MSRYYVIETEGWLIDADRYYVDMSATALHKTPGLSVTVLDRVYCHEAVATFSTRMNGRSMSREHCRRRAQQMCDALNARTA